jgi:type 1 glutamine amidotransferase
VVLHHALLAYPNWSKWRDLVGFDNRSFGYDIGETVRSHLEDPTHPVLAGLSDWEMVDETYKMPEVGADSHLLITYDHPKSVRTIAWTRMHGASRVFCYQAGHDDRTWVDPSFRQVLANGVRWAASSSGAHC